MDVEPLRQYSPMKMLYSRRLCVYVMLNTHRKLVSLPTTSA
jgi:hypothetical protein